MDEQDLDSHPLGTMAGALTEQMLHAVADSRVKGADPISPVG